MKNIEYYLDAAKEKNGLKSDKDVARLLGVSIPMPSQWKTRRSWPSTAVMYRLADIAGEDVEEALLLLNIWKEEEPNARDALQGILKKLRAGSKHAASIAVILGGVFIGINIPQANAGGTKPLANASTYTLCDFRRRRRKALCAA